jgi:uncharacterized protein with HEPN domain
VKDDRVYLCHIRDAIIRIESYVSRGRSAFLAETIIQDAVIRNLEVIGEATKSLSDELRAQHPEVPWSRIAGMRDVLIHEYFGVRLAVWGCREPLPGTQAACRPLADDVGRRASPQVGADGVTPLGSVGRFTETDQYLIITIYEVTDE